MNRKNRTIGMILLVVIMLCTGCSQRTSVQPKVNLKELQEKMLSATENLPKMESITEKTEDANELFAYLSDFPYEKVQEFFFLYSGDSDRAAYEIAVIQVKDENDRRELKESLEKHLENRKRMFQTYAPDQVALVEKAVITESGSYVALIISDHNEEVKAVFTQAMEKEF